MCVKVVPVHTMPADLRFYERRRDWLQVPRTQCDDLFCQHGSAVI